MSPHMAFRDCGIVGAVFMYLAKVMIGIFQADMGETIAFDNKLQNYWNMIKGTRARKIAHKRLMGSSACERLKPV